MMHTLRHMLLSTIILVLSFQSVNAHEQGEFIVRIGPALIEPNDSSDDVEGLPGTEVAVDNNVTLGFTLGYMLTSNLGIELLGVTPSPHDLRGRQGIGALNKIGEVDVFPPTLCLQYYIGDSSKFQPYVGAGINYTHFSNEDTSTSLESALGGSTDLDVDDSWGLAAQVGVDVMLNNKWLVNAAIWYVDIDADATLSTGSVDRDVDIEIDPWVFFIGIGKKF